MNYKAVLMSDKRFDKICGMIRESYPYACILYIDEVINETLENEFKTRSTIIQLTRGKVDRLQLFHGTNGAHIEAIAEYGFDPTKNRVAVYGYGTYFAKNAIYSKNYMKSSSGDEITYMFLADVLIGKLVTGKQRINGANPVYDWDNNVDNTTSPTIYTTPYADGAYPRYIIAFHKNAK